MSFELPDLPYAYDALEPHMSKETLEFHHDKHHNAYVVNGNKALEGESHMGDTLEDLVIKAYEQGKTALFNNAGQHFNHTMFWNSMKPNGGGDIPASLAAAIDKSFGSYDKFRAEFIQAGLTQFGSGWCWLVVNADGKLAVTKTPNGESPLIHGQVPLITCDVWEHSYYIDYRNARPKYMEVFIDKLVNWEFAANIFDAKK